VGIRGVIDEEREEGPDYILRRDEKMREFDEWCEVRECVCERKILMFA
jgi:hypothetical protein